MRIVKLLKKTNFKSGDIVAKMGTAERMFQMSLGVSVDALREIEGKYLHLTPTSDGTRYRFTADNFVGNYDALIDASFNASVLRNNIYFLYAPIYPFMCTTCGKETSDEDHNCDDVFCSKCGRKVRTAREKSARCCAECRRKIVDGFYSYHAHPLRNNLIFDREHLRDSYAHLGVELEIDAGDDWGGSEVKMLSEIINPNAWTPCARFERDSTVGGCECILQPFTLKTLNNMRDRLGDLYNKARELGGRWGKCNGLHIHIDRAYFGEYDKATEASAKLMILIYKYYDFWRAISHREKDRFEWAQKKSGCESIVGAILNTQYPEHRDAVNTSNSNTIELRFFGGYIANASDLLAVADIVNALARWAKESSFGQVEKATPAHIVRYINNPARVLEFCEAEVPNAFTSADAKRVKKDFITQLKKYC